MMKEFLSESIADTAAFAREFLAWLTPHTKGATTVGLYGDLGSGKTTFVQQVAKILGIGGSVQSPTFVIMKKYTLRTTNEIRKYEQLIHIDAYRLDSGADLQKLGWDALASDSKNLIFIEWADRVADILPPDHTKLHFSFINDTTRRIALE